jgi:hypothetical protein
VGGRTRPRKMGPFRPQIAGRNHDFRELSVPPLTEPGRQSGGSAPFLPGVFAPHLSLGAAHPSHMRLLLALRALFFVLLLPGTVAGYIPFSILRAGNLLRVQTSGSPPSAPPSSPSPVLLSSSGASGTSSPQVRALSPLSIPHASLLSEVCIASPATLCTTASSH